MPDRSASATSPSPASKPEEALKIFETPWRAIPGMSRFKETTLGKLEALIALGQLG